MNLMKSQNRKQEVAIFGKDQRGDWKVLLTGFVVIALLALVAGFFVYRHIMGEVGGGAVSPAANGKSVDAGKINRVIYDFEVRKDNFNQLLSE
ncbi:MAG TPA: hypothetical protein P5328_00480 [Candidatus Paceibacterota bacterium]|nr:hypothetical protein [Candidatus Paceibacterota bacterium]HRZ34199.1 hypothetical protein [Candidatus Paceibacterota bacterium]